MSKATYYRLKNAGLGPRETQIPPHRVIITKADEAAWDRARSHPTGTEAELVARMQAGRVRRARNAARAATASPNHVSKRRRR